MPPTSSTSSSQRAFYFPWSTSHPRPHSRSPSPRPRPLSDSSSSKMQRRSTGSNIPRRSIRVYIVVTLLLVGVYVVYRQTTDAISEIHLESRSTTAEQHVDSSCGLEKEERGLHQMDEYVKGFPKLRGHGNLGIPSDVVPRGQEGGGKTVFDWPRTTKLFVL